jgi:DNA-binding FadR family transcriptional regulator
MVKPGKENLYAQVFREIRAYIIQKNLQPGDLLPTEQSLCEMLGVSRNVLREAIKSMELMGLVSAQRGKGTVLQKFNLDFIFQNVIFTNLNDEVHTITDMLDAFLSLKEEDVRNVRRILEHIKERWRKHEFFHADDREFHMAIFANVGNPTLLSLMDAIWSVDENFKPDEKAKHLDDSITKHENIVRALESQNEEAFIAAMMAHFASGKYSKAISFEEY